MYKVCIIEDEIIIRKGLLRAIDWESLDCSVVAQAGDGKEGYKVIESAKPDIIILDINMPIMTGIELLELLPRHTYALIILSGHSEFEYAQKAIQFGVSEYLLKPVDHDALLLSLRRAMKQVDMFRQYQTPISADPYRLLDAYQNVDSITLRVALTYIHEHYHEKITLDDLKMVTGKGTNSIVNRFQKHLNLSFNEYLTKYRMQEALHLIKAQQYHLYEISERVGFADYKYFHKVFTKTVGASPKIVETYYARQLNVDSSHDEQVGNNAEIN